MLIAISANFILVSKEIFHLDSKGFNRAPHIKFHINENVWEINEKLYDIQFVCLLWAVTIDGFQPLYEGSSATHI